jgi:hypothetical protein
MTSDKPKMSRLPGVDIHTNRGMNHMRAWNKTTTRQLDVVAKGETPSSVRCVVACLLRAGSLPRAVSRRLSIRIGQNSHVFGGGLNIELVWVFPCVPAAHTTTKHRNNRLSFIHKPETSFWLLTSHFYFLARPPSLPLGTTLTNPLSSSPSPSPHTATRQSYDFLEGCKQVAMDSHSQAGLGGAYSHL